MKYLPLICFLLCCFSLACQSGGSTSADRSEDIVRATYPGAFVISEDDLTGGSDYVFYVQQPSGEVLRVECMSVSTDDITGIEPGYRGDKLLLVQMRARREASQQQQFKPERTPSGPVTETITLEDATVVRRGDSITVVIRYK